MSKKFKYKNHIIEVEDCDNVSSKDIKKRVISIAKKLDDAAKKYKFEVLWYENGKADPFTKEFDNRKDAMKFYNEHKGDAEKFDFWVTKRDEDWYVVEDIVY